ncbi:MAG TPA: hypothetical protein DDW36_00560 [Candidatus Magasanikbacteria bacterium]|nr:hypothetical protein [Candidatus Magasanikbacteria bacterium]
MKKKILGIFVVLAFIPGVAKAHCPLCTIGAGALAVGAAYIGISTAAVGVFIGAFALALGLWIARLVKKQYIPYQQPILVALIFISTVVPIMPLIREYRSINVYLSGEYGSLLNRTYMFNLFVIGVLIGAGILYVSPFVSAWIKKQRKGRLIPYQGITITFILLASVSFLIQFGL